MLLLALLERDRLFWEKVDVGPGCWNWNGAGANCKGAKYGRTKRLGRMVSATHWALFTSTGVMPPKGSVVLHTCDNPKCVNPKHLVVGTQSENIKDCVQKKRWVPPNPSSLSIADIECMKKMRSVGFTYKAIGDCFGVKLQTAFKWVNASHCGYR